MKRPMLQALKRVVRAARRRARWRWKKANTSWSRKVRVGKSSHLEKFRLHLRIKKIAPLLPSSSQSPRKIKLTQHRKQ